MVNTISIDNATANIIAKVARGYMMGYHHEFFTGHIDEGTQPLPNLGALAFQLFLSKHGLSILDIALAARVRLLIVWKITRGLPISHAQATLVRNGLYQLTQINYRGLIDVHQETRDT